MNNKHQANNHDTCKATIGRLAGELSDADCRLENIKKLLELWPEEHGHDEGMGKLALIFLNAVSLVLEDDEVMPAAVALNNACAVEQYIDELQMVTEPAFAEAA